MTEAKGNLAKIIAASSAGTLIEWYDFYIFGALAVTISQKFFPQGSGATALLSTLATFAIGFVVRPFGALFFGYLGDLIGRKYTFMVTLLLMGGATFAIGLLPSFEMIGWAAPVLLIILRLAQGLALGGEYGGAATYVAEHCPDGQRGYWTSWIQTTATLGLFVSLGVVLICRLSMTPAMFDDWGWRVPFWVSLFLVVFTYFIRRKMQESPLFQRMKASGKSSKNPLKESFGNWVNLKLVLLALFGATAGQGVVWYTGQFYALNFTKLTLGIEAKQAEYIISISLLLATPFFIVFGALSDRIGRKWIMMTGCLLAVATYYPIYSAMMDVSDYNDTAKFKMVSTVSAAPVVKETSTDAAKGVKGKTESSVTETQTFDDGTVRKITKTTTTMADNSAPPAVATKKVVELKSIFGPVGLALAALIWLQVLYVTMVYGPIAAFLVELFPTKIRYTSMSLPYHIGNGVFGGLVPFFGQLITTETKNPLSGLWYPMAIATVTLIIGSILIKENRNVKMQDEH